MLLNSTILVHAKLRDLSVASLYDQLSGCYKLLLFSPIK